MSGPAPAAELPEEFAIFPLAGAVLLPQGRLPLNIFEPRYLAMVEDALAAGRIIAMIQPDPARADGPSGPGLYRVGCLGRLTSFSETDDGRFLITLTGLSRFAVGVELEMRRGYRRMRGNFAAFADDPAPPHAEYCRATLLGGLRAYFTYRGIDANWPAIEAMDNNALVTTLCMVCPFEPAEKQALLEAPTPSARAGALLALLQIDAHAAPDGETRAS